MQQLHIQLFWSLDVVALIRAAEPGRVRLMSASASAWPAGLSWSLQVVKVLIATGTQIERPANFSCNRPGRAAWGGHRPAQPASGRSRTNR
jgi:hypothetical protein